MFALLNKKKTRKINVISDMLFIILFFIIVIGLLWYLSESLDNQQIATDNAKHYTRDQVSMIMTATDNAINKIYNILVVSTIFFTVMVASLSIFQLVKIRDADNVKNDMLKQIRKTKKKLQKKLKQNITENNGKLQLLEEKYNHTFTEFEKRIRERMIELENEYQKKANEIEILTRDLEVKTPELEIDINYLKIQQLKSKTSYSTMEVINAYRKIIELYEKDTSIKNNAFMCKVYTGLAEEFIEVGYDGAYQMIKNWLDKALVLAENVIQETDLYDAYVRLEDMYEKDDGKQIYYLEQMESENPYDSGITIRLAQELDKRNAEGDLEKAYGFLKQAVKWGRHESKIRIFILKEQGKFPNLVNSEYNERINKLIDIYNNTNEE